MNYFADKDFHAVDIPVVVGVGGWGGGWGDGVGGWWVIFVSIGENELLFSIPQIWILKLIFIRHIY